MRSLLLLFSLRLRRTWNARILVTGMLVLIGMTYLKPALGGQAVLWCLYVAGLLSLLIFGQLLQLRRMPFTWALPRSRKAERWFLASAGILIVAVVTVWMVTIPAPLPTLLALSLGVLGYGMGMNPLTIIATLAAVIFMRDEAFAIVLRDPWATLAISLLITGIPIPFAGRALGLWGRREYRWSQQQVAAHGGWRASLARRCLRRPVYTQDASGRDAAALARALAYEDALYAGKGLALRRWWTLPVLMAACFGLWLPGGVLYDVDEYAFLVMISAAIGIYAASKFTVIVPLYGHLYPVSRVVLLRGCWLAHLERLLGLWAMWSTTLWVFCAGLRALHPDLLNGMPSYFPFVSTGFLVCLPMPLAQGFAVHYRGDSFHQYRAADLTPGRALLFIGSEFACVGACFLLVLDAQDWSPLRAVGTLLLVALAAEGLLYWRLRHALLRGNLA